MHTLRTLLRKVKFAFGRRRQYSLRETGMAVEVSIQENYLQLIDNQLDESHSIYDRIKHIEKQIANEKVEIGVIFDNKGAITVVRKGTVNSIRFILEEEKLATHNIVTHNHPNRQYFSDLDVSFAHEVNVLEIRAVAGKKVHRLIRPSQGWNFGPVEELWDSLERKVRHRRKQRHISESQAKKDWLAIGEQVTRKLSLFTEPENL